MQTTKSQIWRSSHFTPVWVIVLFVLIPYVVAVVTGEAESGLTGLAAWHSAAESVYCAKGITAVSRILFVEFGLAVVGTAVLAATAKTNPTKRPKPNWYLLALLGLIIIPFIIAWQTESSVCSRGKAFFWESIFIDVFILAILAVSYNLMFGFTGIVSFGHAAFFGTGAYAIGLFMLHLAWPWWLALIATLALGVVIALIKGFVGLRIKGLYFALFTLAFAELFFLLAGNRIMVNLTGAEDGFTFSVPDWLNMTKNRFFFYYLALFIFVAAFLLVRQLMNSPTGKVLVALRENEDRAQMLGFNTFRFKLIAIVLAGVMATMAGVMRGIALKGASPNVLGLDFTMNPLLMTIVGGMGTFAGPVIGAFALRLTEQFLRDSVLTIGALTINIGDRWPLILGVIFIVSVMVFPYGIVGTWFTKRLYSLDGWLRLLHLRRGGMKDSVNPKSDDLATD